MSLINPRLLVAVGVCIIAGLLGWSMNQPSPPAPPPARFQPPVTPAPIHAEPQSDLDALISQSIHLLEIHDLPNLIKTVMHPNAIRQMMQSDQAASPEQIAAVFRQRMPDMDRQMADMLQALLQAQGQTPELSEGGTRATFALNPPVDNQSELSFVKVDGHWYLR